MTNCQPIFKIFDRIFIVNLPERTDRRKEIIYQLRKLSILENDPRLIFFSAIKPSEPNGFPSIGAYGCFLSHLSILKQIKKLNLNSALIIEDDLNINPELTKNLDKIEKTLKSSPWSFVYLGHVQPVRESGEFTLSPSTSGIQTTHFYGIHKRIIDPLITYLETILTREPGHALGGPMHVDGVFSSFRKKNPEILTLLATPNMGVQRSSASDIANSPLSKYITFLHINFLIVFYRKLKNYYKGWS